MRQANECKTLPAVVFVWENMYSHNGKHCVNISRNVKCSSEQNVNTGRQKYHYVYLISSYEIFPWALVSSWMRLWVLLAKLRDDLRSIRCQILTCYQTTWVENLNRFWIKIYRHSLAEMHMKIFAKCLPLNIWELCLYIMDIWIYNTSFGHCGWRLSQYIVYIISFKSALCCDKMLRVRLFAIKLFFIDTKFGKIP